MAGRIVLFGATGYTGRLTAERLVAAGERPVLAGRDPQRLEALAHDLGADLETVRADVLRANSVFDLVGANDVLVTTVGPFAKFGAPALRAAIAAGATYVDSTGEPAFIRRVFEEFDRPAREAGSALLTAMGYDYVPGALAGALALEDAGETAVRVDVGYYVVGSGRPSPGTVESLAGAMLDPAFAYRDGRLVTERGAARVRDFPVAGRSRPAFSIGSAEHFGLPAAYPRLREVNAYLGWFGPLTRAVQAASLAGAGAQRLPGARRVMQAATGRLVSLTPTRDHGSVSEARSWVAAEAYDAGGAKLAEVHLEGVDGYDFTAGLLAWAARRASSAGVDGTGALGPVSAFGLGPLEQGCAEAGIRRTEA